MRSILRTYFQNDTFQKKKFEMRFLREKFIVFFIMMILRYSYLLRIKTLATSSL